MIDPFPNADAPDSLNDDDSPSLPSKEHAWLDLYQEVTNYHAHMERFYAAVGRLVILKQSNPHETRMIEELTAQIETMKGAIQPLTEKLLYYRAQYETVVLTQALDGLGSLKASLSDLRGEDEKEKPS